MQREKWGMRGRKEGGKNSKMVSLGPGSPVPRGSCGCVTFHYLLSILNGKVFSWFALVWETVCSPSLSPQAVGCDMIDLGGGKSHERASVSPCSLYRLHAHTQANKFTHMLIGLDNFFVSAGVLHVCMLR